MNFKINIREGVCVYSLPFSYNFLSHLNFAFFTDNRQALNNWPLFYADNYS